MHCTQNMTNINMLLYLTQQSCISGDGGDQRHRLHQAAREAQDAGGRREENQVC